MALISQQVIDWTVVVVLVVAWMAVAWTALRPHAKDKLSGPFARAERRTRGVVDRLFFRWWR